MLKLITWPRNAWSIFDELESLRAGMRKTFDGEGSDDEGRRVLSWRSRPTYPLMNVWSSPDGIIVDAEVPGVDPKDVEVSVSGDQLTIRGKVNPERVDRADTYYRCERLAGDFERTLQLPFRAVAEAVKANYRNGILRLTVPRSEAEKPRKIAVEAA